jgi:xanthine phosphoribosyltransferase
MKALKQAILNDGKAIGSDIIKVDMFLNHRIDTALITEMGNEFARRFKDAGVDTILTIEASGIAAAVTTAQALGNVPIVFAKKGETRNVNGELYTAKVYSFTHQKENTIRVCRDYLKPQSKVLIIDDFLANGEAAQGLISLCRQAGAEVVGIGICVEKGYQPGGKQLREAGLRVESLAIVDAVENGKIILRGDD